MADQTVTTSKTISEVITDGLADQENITVNAGGTVTFDVSPSVLIGNMTINAGGRILLDGANATNPIIITGEALHALTVGGSGSLECTLGWWEFPTTGDGTASQTFNSSTYFSADTNNNITADVFSGVWVETGRRIDYDGGSGTLPVVGDWVFATADNDIHGRITEVSGTAASGYIVVRFLTGSLADNDSIEVQKVADSNGPLMSKTWTASVNNASGDILEAGVYQEFGNVYQGGSSRLTSMGTGMSGFCFSQPFGSNTLTFGDGTNGFIVPNGAHIRVPMVHLATANSTDYAAGNTTMGAEAETDRYELLTTGGGDVDIAGLSVGSAYIGGSSAARNYNLSYVAGNVSLANTSAGVSNSFSNCICVSDITASNFPASAVTIGSIDSSIPVIISDCLSLSMVYGSRRGLGFDFCNDIEIRRCIVIGDETNDNLDCFWTNSSGTVIDDVVVIGSDLVMSGLSNSTINNLKVQRKIDGSSGNHSYMLELSSCSNLYFSGVWYLKESFPTANGIWRFVDNSDIKIRCSGFIDAKIDKGTGPVFGLLEGINSDISIARVWFDSGGDLRIAAAIGTASSSLEILNSSMDYAGLVLPSVSNASFRGLHGGSGSLGAGTETDYSPVYGNNCHDIFRSDTTGAFFFNFCAGSVTNPITIVSGTPLFSLDGDMDLDSGDQIIIEMPYYARGHTGFTGSFTTSQGAGTVADGTDEWGSSNVDIEFQYDQGSGYNGTWLDLRTSSNLTGITSPETGIKLKLRITGLATITDLNGLLIHTTTTLSDQLANLHPVDQQEATVTLTPLISGSEVRIFTAGTSTELTGIETSGTSFTYTYQSASPPTVDVVIMKPGYKYLKLSSITLSSSSANLPVSQQIDRQYENP